MRRVLDGVAAVAVGFAAMVAVAQKPAPLVVISVDGMKPEYATHAAEHGLKIPELRSFLTQGTYAEGVIGVVPTVTYPSHTTLITGVPPAEHGVFDNTLFDPLGEHPGQWYWDFSWLKVETLYQAADKAGLKTAAVGWPVTVGAPIDYLIAEGAQSERTDKPAGPAYAPADIVAQLGVKQGKGQDEDDVKTGQAVGILRKWKPGLLLVHLTDLDEEEHGHGPFSTEADAALEKIDGQIKLIDDAAIAVDPATRIVIVSDHGFEAVDHNVNLNVLLAQAGLIRLGPPADGKKRPTVISWDAEAWPAGGSTAVMLRDPNDAATMRKVTAVIDALKADPKYKVAHVLDHAELVKRGGFPEAAYLVDFKDGMEPGTGMTGDVISETTLKGMHGFVPWNPEMRSTFMAKGAGIAQARDLKVVNMLQVAPTLAGMLDVTLPAAKAQPLDVKP